MLHRSSTALRRTVAFGLDWLAIVAWGGFLLGAMMLATRGDLSGSENPWVGQALGFVVMTLPVILVFAWCESSRRQATPGKSAAGLVVTDRTGGRLRYRCALLRNGVKFTPWEFGHTVVHQAVHAGEQGFPVWLWGPVLIAFGGSA